jgi:hypothetical protein
VPAAVFVARHSGKHCSRAERQPLAGNFHARMKAARPRVPFLQKLFGLLHQKLRFL